MSLCDTDFISSGYICPEVGLLNHRVILFWLFWGNSIVFSMKSALICVPTNRCKVFLFPYIFTNVCYLFSFLLRSTLTSHWDLICVSLMLTDIDYFPIPLWVICMSCFERCFFRSVVVWVGFEGVLWRFMCLGLSRALSSTWLCGGGGTFKRQNLSKAAPSED